MKCLIVSLSLSVVAPFLAGEEKPTPITATPPTIPATTPATTPTTTATTTTAPDAAEPEPYTKVTQKEIDAITYEDCDDDEGVTFPFLPNFERATSNEDRKKDFDEWKEKLESWDCNDEKKIGQRVRNFISLMCLVDILQMPFEGETPLILLNRMKKEIPKNELLKAAAYCALKPDEGTVIEKCAAIGLDDGAAEDRIRERMTIYSKKVVGRLLGKLPPKEETQK